MNGIEQLQSFCESKIEATEIHADGAEQARYIYPNGTSILITQDPEHPEDRLYLTTDGKSFYFLPMAEFNQFIMVEQRFEMA